MNRFHRFGMAIVAVCILLCFAISAASAQTPDDIAKKGKLVVGMLVDAPPFGTTDKNLEPDGFDADLAKRLAKFLGVAVEIVPLTPPTRIPALTSGRIDILVASFAVTPERARQVWFTNPYNALDMVLLAPKSRPIRSASDLAGLKIGTTRGSLHEALITKLAPPTSQIIRFDDDATAYQALLAKQVDTLGIAGALAAEVMKANPAADLETKILLQRTPVSMAIRRGETELLRWLNSTIFAMKNNGELDELHRKWLDSPSPDLPSF
ncbi:transporter substrate-binding domain-containing protein [Bradyrhizobium sp. LA7.1]|uniref:transporter substrate-binding domain-containing protein n=1 Tax=Bradyrhizobium sp. LA7.1 TaxID=3156324 RepID=UPI0033991095